MTNEERFLHAKAAAYSEACKQVDLLLARIQRNRTAIASSIAETFEQEHEDTELDPDAFLERISDLCDDEERGTDCLKDALTDVAGAAATAWCREFGWGRPNGLPEWSGPEFPNSDNVPHGC